MKRRTRQKLLFVKLGLLVFAALLFGSSVLDMLSFQPNNPSCGGACIEVSTTTVTIEGVNFIGTVWGSLLGSVLTVFALGIDVTQQYIENEEHKGEPHST